MATHETTSTETPSAEHRLELGQVLTLKLESWGRLGEAVAYHHGREVFVLGGIPGERVEAEVLRVRRGYASAQVVQVLTPSEDRVDPPCEYYGACTGCQWQHLGYAAQLEAKHAKVTGALRRVGGFDDLEVRPVLPSPGTFGYRNHARMTVGPDGALGFVHRETRRFVRIDGCGLMHPGVNRILSQLQDKCRETTQLSIRAGEQTGDYLVQPPLSNPEIAIATGQTHYVESVNDRRFRVASPSFFQVNNRQAANLVHLVRAALELTGSEVVLDAYTGVGAFAILLSPHVRRVVAVEESSAAVADARDNAAGLENVEFVLGKTEDVLESIDPPPDVVILDPPRAGCQVGALRSLVRLAPRRVVYVSCDPETLARDLKLLCGDDDAPYLIDQVQPLDMFPQTHHVECVAVLERARPAANIVLASGSPRRRELLADLGMTFRVIPSDADETVVPGETAQEMVRRLSLKKAQAVASALETPGDNAWVIGADSTVVLDGKIIGKPDDPEDARRMLAELSGTRHQVTTGVTVVNVASGRFITDCLTGDIAMRELSYDEIAESVATGTPMDKAGAYAIQDDDLKPGELVDGCFTNVVGLPLCRLLEMLDELGCPRPPAWVAPPQPRCRTGCPFSGNSPTGKSPGKGSERSSGRGSGG